MKLPDRRDEKKKEKKKKGRKKKIGDDRKKQWRVTKFYGAERKMESVMRSNILA